MLLDWDNEAVALFVNGEYKTRTGFFSSERDEMLGCDETFVNALMLYTLTSGMQSSFKDVRLCTELCPGTQEAELPLTDTIPEGSRRSQDPLADPFIVLTDTSKYASSAVEGMTLASLAVLSFAFVHIL